MKPTIFFYKATPIAGDPEEFEGLSHTTDDDKWVVTLPDKSTREFSKKEYKTVVATTFIPYTIDPPRE